MQTFTIFIPTEKIKYEKTIPNVYDWGTCVKQFYTTEDLFMNNDVEPQEKTLEDIFKMVQSGVAIYPINKTSALDVKRLEAMGLRPVFMKAGSFIKMKKAYKDFI